MKVDIRNIPDNIKKPEYSEERKNLSFFDDDDDENVERLVIGEDNGDDEADAKKMINFSDTGKIISLMGIESIEKDMAFVEKPKAHWEFGIIINKGIEPNIRFPKTNISVWFMKEEVRDVHWDNLLLKLKEERFRIINV